MAVLTTGEVALAGIASTLLVAYLGHRREMRRMREEANRERERWKVEERRAFTEHWADRRLDAHTEFIYAANTWHYKIRSFVMASFTPADAREREEFIMELFELEMAITPALLKLDLLADEPARKASREMVQKLGVMSVWARASPPLPTMTRRR